MLKYAVIFIGVTEFYTFLVEIIIYKCTQANTCTSLLFDRVSGKLISLA